MTPTEKKYVEKLKELSRNYKLFRKVTDKGVKNTCIVKMDELESEIASLAQQIEAEGKTVSDEICDSCGKQMQPTTKPDYLCMNPECDNYIKLLNNQTNG